MKKCIVITSHHNNEGGSTSTTVCAVVEGGLALEPLKKALEQEILPKIMNWDDLRVVPKDYKFIFVSADSYGMSPYGTVEIKTIVEYVGADPTVQAEYPQNQEFYFRVSEFNLVSP